MLGGGQGRISSVDASGSSVVITTIICSDMYVLTDTGVVLSDLLLGLAELTIFNAHYTCETIVISIKIGRILI